jgi:hypothetical protein
LKVGAQVAHELPTATKITLAALLDKILENQATATSQTEEQKEKARTVSSYYYYYYFKTFL